MKSYNLKSALETYSDIIKNDLNDDFNIDDDESGVE